PLTDLAVTPGRQNLLVNPGFEAGLNGWSPGPGSGTQSAKPFEGSTYYFAGSTAVNGVEQTVNLLTAGISAAAVDSQDLVAVFGGRIRSASETPTDRGSLTLTFLDGSGGEISHATVNAQNATDRWEL